MDRMIRVMVAGHYLTKDSNIAGIQRESNVRVMRIEFDPGWDGVAKKVTFWDADGKHPVERVLTADLLEDMATNTRAYLCPIPGEAMMVAGEMTFIIDGYVEGKRQRSMSDTLKVKAAPFIEKAGEPADPTPTQAEQLQVQIDTLLGDMQAVARDAELARDAAVAIVGGSLDPASFLANKADLVNGKVPLTQLPNAAEIGAVTWDNGVLGAVDILTWAEGQATPTMTAATPSTTNMPYPDYWTIDLKISAVGAWRRIVARCASAVKTDIRERYCINGEWGEWEQIATTSYALSKSGDMMTGSLQVAINGGNAVLVSDPACAYLQSFKDGDWDRRRTLLLRNVDTSPDLTSAVTLGVQDGNGWGEYALIHQKNLHLIDPSAIGAAKVKNGSYVGNGRRGAQDPNVIEFGFEPKFVAIQKADASGSVVWAMWMKGSSQFMAYGSNYSNSVSSPGATFSWYSLGDAAGQLNESGVVYHYIAFG